MNNNKLNLLVIAIIASIGITPSFADTKIRLKTNNDFVVEDRETNAPRLIVKNTGDVLIPEGNVGIGTESPTAKLEVNGYIKVGSSDTLGDTTPQAGMIRFNTSLNTFQAYDGTAWTDLH